MIPIAEISPSFSLDAALMAVVGAIATFAVCRWRIGDLERRVKTLEDSERNHSDRVVVTETEIKAIKEILERIESKIDRRH